LGLGVSLLGRPLQHRHAIRVGCGFGKRIIADSLKKGHGHQVDMVDNQEYVLHLTGVPGWQNSTFLLQLR
jgi:hypothetical protein